MSDRRSGFDPAHDPPKCERFGDKIMRLSNILKRDRTQNRIPLLPIALLSGIWLTIRGLSKMAGP
jgi:hypothetical protein